jgi:membrane fusion protein, heavy metal efflux system
MNHAILLVALLVLAGCNSPDASPPAHGAPEEVARGPNNGRMLLDGDFALELAIFESGVPPEYHAWPTLDGKPAPLDQVDLTVELHRLGGKVDRFSFTPHGDYLRGDGVVKEPHSFVVNVSATHQGQRHAWKYDSFEGRTTIAPDIAATAGIKTETAGSATLTETLTLYGRVVPAPSRQREVSARYPGVIRTVNRKVGDTVRQGEPLATIESDESLQTYAVGAPISGVLTTREANPGEHSGQRALFTIMDPSSVWVELSLFPRDRSRVRPGAMVRVKAADSEVQAVGKIERVDVQAGANQAVIARASLANPRGEFLLGSFVTADVAVAERTAPLAVKTSGLQPFRDFTVVFEQVADTYEVRMLELGERQGEWVEVLGGLEPGARYVTENSYLLKADIEKSGASHDH